MHYLKSTLDFKTPPPEVSLCELCGAWWWAWPYKSIQNVMWKAMSSCYSLLVLGLRFPMQSSAIERACSKAQNSSSWNTPAAACTSHSVHTAWRSNTKRHKEYNNFGNSCGGNRGKGSVGSVSGNTGWKYFQIHGAGKGCCAAPPMQSSALVDVSENCNCSQHPCFILYYRIAARVVKRLCREKQQGDRRPLTWLNKPLILGDVHGMGVASQDLHQDFGENKRMTDTWACTLWSEKMQSLLSFVLAMSTKQQDFIAQ